MAKQRVAVLFGGMSSEYEISCISAAAVIDHIDRDKYDVMPIGITKNGRWLLFPGSTDLIREGKWETFPDCAPAFISPDRTTHGIVTSHEGSFDVVKLDMVFPVLHGYGGEDGSVQGLLELAGIPYVGCDVLSSAMTMDKAVANLVFDAAGIPHTPWLAITRREAANFDDIVARVQGKLAFPIFVKPATSGSSIGVSKAVDWDSLRTAIQLASAHGPKIVLEQAVVGQEVECAVLGNHELFGTLPGEIVSCNEIYDYEAKYQSGDASVLHLPARLDKEKLEEVRDMALVAYRALGCTGLSRVDFFVEEGTQRVILNEINTIPGFTPISMYPKLMEHAGISFTQLTDRLLQLAFERMEA